MTMMNFKLATLAAELGPFARRVVEEALTTAMPAFWERRAVELDEARPRRSDFNGRASSTAAREHTELLRMFPEEEAVVGLVADVWDEVRAA